jgi:hypothetical protein
MQLLAGPLGQTVALAVGVILVVDMIVGLAGCGSGSGSSSVSTAASPASGDPASSAGTPRPSATVSAPSAAATLPSASAAVPLPPRAELTTVGGTNVDGRPGSYLVGTFGSDSPWLPARVLTPLSSAPGASLRITFPGDPLALIGSWTASLADAADEPGAHLTALGASVTGQPVSAELDLRGPGAGTWVMAVDIRFANGNSAVYFWQLKVR